MTYRQWLATIFCVANALAQATTAPTPAQHQLTGWLNVINRGEAAGILNYFEKNYPNAPNKSQNAIELSERTGGVKVLNTLDSTPDSVTMLVKMKSADRFAKLTLKTEAAEPHRIASVRIEPADRPQEFAPARLREAEAIAAIRAEVEGRASQD